MSVKKVVLLALIKVTAASTLMGMFSYFNIKNQCTKTDAQNNCIEWVSIEDGYAIRRCKAPVGGTCTAVLEIGNKKAVCTATNGNECSAKIKI